MSIAVSVPKVTAVHFKGLNELKLPFYSHLLDGDETLSGGLITDNAKYYVKSVTGLEAPNRDIAISSTAGGGRFQGVTTESREVVALIGLNPDWDNGETPQDLRSQLYPMLTPGYDPRIDIQLVSGDNAFAHEYAYVEKFEASIFDQNPAVQLTFITLNPTFKAFSQTSYNPSDLTEVRPNVVNPGTAETGFKFAVKFNDDKNGWFIKSANNPNIGMTFDKQFHAGDVLSVSTIPGQMYVHWNKHRGKVHNALGILTKDSEWIKLHPGNNVFVASKKTSAWSWHGKFSFTKHYWGI